MQRRSNAVIYKASIQSQLNVIVQQCDFFSRLEGWQSNVWTTVASESITKGAVAAAAHLALDRKVYLCKIVFTKL